MDLKTFLNINSSKKWLVTVKKNPIWKQQLSEIYPSTVNLKEQIYLYFNDLDKPPTCSNPSCSKTVSWHVNRYSNTCSHQCANQLLKHLGKDQEIKTKIRKTNQEKYGCDNPLQNAAVKKQRLATMHSKYQAGASPRARQAASKRMQTLNQILPEILQEKYGVVNVQQIPEVRQRSRETLLANHNVINPSQILYIQQQRQEDLLINWQSLCKNVVINQILDDVTTDLPFANKRISFICCTCHLNQTLPSETFKWRIREANTPCISCSGIKSGSLEERDVAEFIEQQGFQIIRNARHVIAPKELDIWIPQTNIAIEYCGLYWHSESQIADKNYHRNKWQLCQDKNIRLIQVFQDEWLHNGDLVKSRLLHILQKQQIKIHARKTKIIEISTKQARAFALQHHIQGPGTGNICLGLHYNDDLVAVMDFGKLSISKGQKHVPNTYELTRFSSSYPVPGGASKLFSYFINKYQPQAVYSYSDLRWNTGQLYKTLGFQFVTNTNPNYWYVRGNKRHHRYSFRKDQLVKLGYDATKTERQIMEELGYGVIWDCGHSKWLWTKKPGI